jgi:prevent-host-death family protein
MQMGDSQRRCGRCPLGRELPESPRIRALHVPPDEVDAIAAYCADLGECYILPIELVAGQYQAHLRLVPPRNGQRAALNWAADHQLPGAIAQLGERCHGMAEVVGSSPTGSTSDPSPAGVVEVGAHEFRNRFGWYMERAAAGEELLVTRRGKPYVRLVPAKT